MLTREQVRPAARVLSRYGWEHSGREKRRRTLARNALNQAQHQATMETLLDGRLKGLAIARQRTHHNRGAARRMAAGVDHAREDAQLTD